MRELPGRSKINILVVIVDQQGSRPGQTVAATSSNMNAISNCGYNSKSAVYFCQLLIDPSIKPQSAT
jgi:hypothetical protein